MCEWQGCLDLSESQNKRVFCSEERGYPDEGGSSLHSTPAKLLSPLRVDRSLGGRPGPGEQTSVRCHLGVG